MLKHVQKGGELCPPAYPFLRQCAAHDIDLSLIFTSLGHASAALGGGLGGEIWFGSAPGVASHRGGGGGGGERVVGAMVAVVGAVAVRAAGESAAYLEAAAAA